MSENQTNISLDCNKLLNQLSEIYIYADIGKRVIGEIELKTKSVIVQVKEALVTTPEDEECSMSNLDHKDLYSEIDIDDIMGLLSRELYIELLTAQKQLEAHNERARKLRAKEE